MKKFLTTIIALIFLFSGLYAQKNDHTTPDMQKIRKEVRDMNSPYYYPQLVKKYESTDTTMTVNDYRYLYYGYAFQEDYNPYRTSAYSSELNKLYTKQKHTPAECDSIIKYAQLSLADFPFDLRQMNLLIYAYKEKQKFAWASLWEYRFNHIINAILSSGDGKTQKTAWYVIHPTHEYNIINRLGYTGKEYHFEDPYYDHITVEKNPLGIKGFYFNVKQILNEYNKKYGEE